MVSKDEIQNLGALARLELTDVEVETLQHDISNILEYVGQLSAVAPSEIKEVGVVHNVMRGDTPRAADDALLNKRESILAALPKREGDYNVVRKIIQKDE